MGVCYCGGRKNISEQTVQSSMRTSREKNFKTQITKQKEKKDKKNNKRIYFSQRIPETNIENYLEKQNLNGLFSGEQNQSKINNLNQNKNEEVNINQNEIIKSSKNKHNISISNQSNIIKASNYSINCDSFYNKILNERGMSENPNRYQSQMSIKNSAIEGTTNISNNNKTSNQQLTENNESQIINLFSKENEKEINFNFQLNQIQLNDGEKAGCGANYINTFCNFTSSNGESFLVFPVKNAFQNYIRIYNLNLDNNKKEILYDQFDIDSSGTTKTKRHIPTQCRHFKIEEDDFLITGYRDSYIFIYKYENNEFKEIKVFCVGGETINGVCLFKNKSTNEINIITSQINTSKITIADLNEKNNGIIKHIEVEDKIFFLDIFSKDNKNYFIVGFLNEVIIALELQLYDKMPSKVKHYRNIKRQNNCENTKGHECAIIYKSKENKNNIKLIDSDVEGKLINIFDFQTTALLLVLDLKICKPLGLDIWDSNHIIVSCFQDENNDSIKIIKANLEKENYNKNYIDLKQNEIGEEAKIVCHLKGHEDGVLSCLKMKNKLNEEFLISIGRDGKLKQWQNKLSKISLSFAYYNNQSDY